MIITALLAGLFSGLIGAMGLGGGAVLIIYLTLFTDTPQLEAQGINLLFFIPIAAAAVTVYAVKKQIKWKMTLKITLWGLIGVIIGMYFARILGGELTAKVLGGLLVIIGISEIFTKSATLQINLLLRVRICRHTEQKKGKEQGTDYETGII